MKSKKNLQNQLDQKGVRWFKSWPVAKLENALEEAAHIIGVKVVSETCEPAGNWNTAKDWFPDIEVDQENRIATVTRYDSSGYQRNASISTEALRIDRSECGTQVFLRGSVSCRNWNHPKCSGEQGFCFALFVGDSEYVYIHRAKCSKGWMEAKPENIRKRLRILGIGANAGVIQQGDFLLKPARRAYPDEVFLHESMGAGRHKFDRPVLYHTGQWGGQYWVTESTRLIHTADDIQHPTVVIPPGKWVVGTTANQLSHRSQRGD